MKLLIENWRGYVKEDVELNIGSSTHPHQNLNEKLWDENDQLKPEVKERLLEIAQQFISKTQGSEANIKDIILTGSLANYNYSILSDIDLHLLLDFAELNSDEDLVKDYFDAVKALWNYLHDIKIKGHEVEIYVQNEREPHVSTGIYSLLNDDWVKKPEVSVIEDSPADNATIEKKVNSLMDQIDRALSLMDKQKYDEAHARANKISEKIKKFRRAGLEGIGEYSVENLAFKKLRNNGYLGKLSDLKRESYDSMMSLKENK
jgi:predicted nucleotidyltransferase